MGCRDSKEALPSFHLTLTRTSIRPLDDFYADVERVLLMVQSLKESIDIVVDKFEVVTGLCDWPRRSLALGLLGFIVLLLARREGKVVMLDVQFADCLPGVILNEKKLTQGEVIVYHSWLELTDFLDYGVRHLQELAPAVVRFLPLARTFPLQTFPSPQSSDLRVIDYRKLEKTADDNFAKVKSACEVLGRVLSGLKSYVTETVITVQELSNSQDLTPLLKLSSRVKKQGLDSVPEVLRECGFDLEQLINTRRRQLMAMDSPAETF
jgi:hypothetical protein